MIKIFAIGAAMLLFAALTIPVRAQEGALEGIIRGVEGGDILESLILAIGEILSESITGIINAIVFNLCVSPLLSGAIGCLFCCLPGPICCIRSFAEGIIKTMIELCLLLIRFPYLIARVCGSNILKYAINGVTYSAQKLLERLWQKGLWVLGACVLGA